MPTKLAPLKIRTIEEGSAEPEYELAPGVMGVALKDGLGKIYIPSIRAVKEGNGDVGRFLDRCSANVVIPNVLSKRLLGMLMRRGWSQDREWAGPPFNEWCMVWTPPAHQPKQKVRR